MFSDKTNLNAFLVRTIAIYATRYFPQKLPYTQKSPINQRHLLQQKRSVHVLAKFIV
jgi:hypothetical protein